MSKISPLDSVLQAEKKGSLKLAIQACLQVIQKHEKKDKTVWHNAMVKLVALHQKGGDYQASTETMEKLCQFYKQEVKVQQEKLLGFLKSSVNWHGRWHRMLCRKAQDLYHLGKYKEAMQAIEEAVKVAEEVHKEFSIYQETRIIIREQIEVAQLYFQMAKRDPQKYEAYLAYEQALQKIIRKEIDSIRAIEKEKRDGNQQEHLREMEKIQRRYDQKQDRRSVHTQTEASYFKPKKQEAIKGSTDAAPRTKRERGGK